MSWQRQHHSAPETSFELVDLRICDDHLLLSSQEHLNHWLQNSSKALLNCFHILSQFPQMNLDLPFHTCSTQQETVSAIHIASYWINPIRLRRGGGARIEGAGGTAGHDIKTSLQKLQHLHTKDGGWGYRVFLYWYQCHVCLDTSTTWPKEHHSLTVNSPDSELFYWFTYLLNVQSNWFKHLRSYTQLLRVMSR